MRPSLGADPEPEPESGRNQGWHWGTAGQTETRHRLYLHGLRIPTDLPQPMPIMRRNLNTRRQLMTFIKLDRHCAFLWTCRSALPGGALGGAAVGQGRIDLSVGTRRGFCAAGGAAETEALQVAVDLSTR